MTVSKQLPGGVFLTVPRRATQQSHHQRDSSLSSLSWISSASDDDLDFEEYFQNQSQQQQQQQQEQNYPHHRRVATGSAVFPETTLPPGSRIIVDPSRRHPVQRFPAVIDRGMNDGTHSSNNSSSNSSYCSTGVVRGPL